MFFFLRSVLLRRFGPLGVALTAYDIWRRLPKQRRQQVIRYARSRGERLAKVRRPPSAARETP